eukprot:865941-Alexandrium_andersonii.AAC.1
MPFLARTLYFASLGCWDPRGPSGAYSDREPCYAVVNAGSTCVATRSVSASSRQVFRERPKHPTDSDDCQG